MRCFTPRLRLFGRERDVDARAGSGSYEKLPQKQRGAHEIKYKFPPENKKGEGKMKNTSTNTLSNCNSLTATASMNQTGPPKNFATRLRAATLHASRQQKLKRVGISLAMGLLAAILGAGFANAQVVAVTNEQFPLGGALPGGDTLKSGCETETAQETIIDTAGTYTFLFWNVNGSVQWSQTATFCTGATNGFATAWYVVNGSGNCKAPNCYVSTFGFDMKDNVALPIGDGTPIGLVSPNLQPDGTAAWISPSAIVLTGEGESITAKSSLAVSPFAAQPFRYWQTVPYPQTTPPTLPTPIGVVFQAAANATSWVVAFYGPDPCQTLRNELASCLAGDGEGGKLNCAPFGKALAVCEQEHREPQ
jgi:hypothetical protein